MAQSVVFESTSDQIQHIEKSKALVKESRIFELKFSQSTTHNKSNLVMDKLSSLSKKRCIESKDTSNKLFINGLICMNTRQKVNKLDPNRTKKSLVDYYSSSE